MLIHCVCRSGTLLRLGSYQLRQSISRPPNIALAPLVKNYSALRATLITRPRQLLKTDRLRLVRCRNGAAPQTAKTKVKVHRKDVMRLVNLAKSEKAVLTAAIGCLVVSSIITMSVPFALGKILDIIFDQTSAHEETLQSLRKFTLLLFGIFIIGGLANFGRIYLFNSASLRIVQRLRSKVYKTMIMQEASWFDTKGAGELLNRLINDTYFVGNSLSQNLSDGLRFMVMVMAGTGMMIYTSPQLAIISTCVVPAIAGMAILYGRYVRRITRMLLDKFAEISKSVEERLGNVKTVKIFCKEEEECKAFDRQLSDALSLGYNEVRARSFFFGWTGFTGNVIIVSVLYYGGTLVMSNILSIGELTSFIMYAAYTAVSINGLSTFYSELNKGIGAGQRIWDIMDRPSAIPLHAGVVPLTKPIGEICFDNVQFTYPTRPNVKILNDFNLMLLPNQTTAVVGRSGVGKTTITSLLLRLYDPQQGRILLDGMDIRGLSPLWLRSHIGAVSQEPVLFSGSIRDNILYALQPGVKCSEDDFQLVVHKAHVDEFANNLPDGLNTMVGNRGIMLSGGQKQRVAIARALIKNPTVLILDEATSALDAESEHLVQEAMEELFRGRTVLTIAHRLSTIRTADQIVVLECGRVEEQGSYDNLINNKSGHFMNLVRYQAFDMNI